MYYPNHIEDICYEIQHMNKVTEEIRNNFDNYFEKYLETEAGNRRSAEEVIRLAEIFGETERFTIKNGKKTINMAKAFITINKEAINSYEKDRESYLEIMNQESLEEHSEDPPNFKNSVLKNTCPIIRLTLQNRKAKELDKYRLEFKRSDPNDLLRIVNNLSNFASHYVENFYDEDKYENVKCIDDMGLSELDTVDYTVFGVIGGGIKSHLIYKVNPAVFPNRGREAIWALWYLTNKKTFNCEQDSEFLMINLTKYNTQQNYFYPYVLFSYYAFQIYKMMKEKAEKFDVLLDPNYRYVFVDSFLSFIARLHSDEIEFLKSTFTEDNYGYH